jgi:hypothetical protein
MHVVQQLKLLEQLFAPNRIEIEIEIHSCEGKGMIKKNARGDMDVADLTTVRFVGLDVDSTVGIPQAESPVLATAEAVVAISIEPHRQHRPFVPFQHARFIHRQVGPTRHL